MLLGDFGVAVAGGLAKDLLKQLYCSLRGDHQSAEPLGLQDTDSYLTTQALDSASGHSGHSRAAETRGYTAYFNNLGLSETTAATAALFLRACAHSTDGKIRVTGDIMHGRSGPYPIGEVEIQVRGETLCSRTASEAIRIVSAVDLLRRNHCINYDQCSGGTRIYSITPRGVETESRLTFRHVERPPDAIPPPRP